MFIRLLLIYFGSMKKFIIGGLLMSPVMAFAQTPLENTVNAVQNIIDLLIPLLLALAVLLFFWGLVKYIANASDEAAKESGKTLMSWGMIAIFVMVAFWGIIGYVQESTGLSGSVTVVNAPATGNLVPS
ncbi:MAG: hypothetical protein UY04_C0012G0027 [Parcubacteria group bacterium GW2011_GWA2_47_7]|nr:MAG: hypothetical protein UY04_C0012G0027 [Parcubacteria group bacterium GW2011_GWA2_47_7]